MSENESEENRRRRLLFRAGHRGTKEMDLLLGSFAEKHVFDLTSAELDQFEEILSINDPDLYNWMTGKEEPPANVMNGVFEKLQAHSFVERT